MKGEQAARFGGSIGLASGICRDVTDVPFGRPCGRARARRTFLCGFLRKQLETADRLHLAASSASGFGLVSRRLPFIRSCLQPSASRRVSTVIGGR
jgi:hypothetical protein